MTHQRWLTLVCLAALLAAPFGGTTSQAAVSIFPQFPAAPVYPVDWQVAGPQANSWYGRGVGAAGDVNADGYDDVIVGDPAYNNNYIVQGRAWVYYGGAGGISTTHAWTVGSSDTDGYVYFGQAVEGAGDVNNDGYGDVLVGAPNLTDPLQQQGGVYVYHSGPGGLSTTPARIYRGEAANYQLGAFIAAAGDVNNDNYDDVLIGAPVYANGQAYEGQARLYLGSASGLPATPSWTFEPDLVNAVAGWQVKPAGDINRDGYADFFVGAPGANSGRGIAWLFFGGPGGPGAVPAWSMAGTQNDENCAQALAGGMDFNNDTYPDVAVSCPNYQPVPFQRGRVAVYFGGPSGLSSTPGWNLYNQVLAATVGLSLAGAGDFNNDGYDDLLVSSQGNANTNINGELWLFFGGSAGLSSTPLRFSDSTLLIDFGNPVSAAGDVNNDGYGDFIFGAGTNRAYGYYGETVIPVSGLAAWNDSPTDLGLTTTLSATLTAGNYVNFLWNFGDSHSAAGQVVTHTYSTPGVYTATVTASNGFSWQQASTRVTVRRTCWARVNNSPVDYLSVQAAIAASAPGDTVKLAGTCRSVNQLGGEAQVAYIAHSLTLRGGYTVTNWTTANPGAHPTTIDPAGKGRGVTVWNAGAVSIETLNLVNGVAPLSGGPRPTGRYGGGLDATSSRLSLFKVVISNCQAETGGGLDAAFSYLTIQDSTIENNVASQIGGGITTHIVTGTLSGNTIRNNSGFSGGIDLDATGVVTLSYNTIVSNTALSPQPGWWGYGGGLMVDECTRLTLIGNLFQGNTAQASGGGAHIYSCPTLARGNLFSGNIANDDFAALQVITSTLQLSGNRFLGNRAADEGGALGLIGAPTWMENDALAGNLAAQGSGIVLYGSPLTATHTTLAANPGSSAVYRHPDPYLPPGPIVLTNTLVYSQSLAFDLPGPGWFSAAGILWDQVGVTVTHPSTATVLVSGQVNGPALLAADGYHLTTGSAAVDAALPGAASHDIDGEPRPAFRGYDLGADELISAQMTLLPGGSASTPDGLLALAAPPGLTTTLVITYTPVLTPALTPGQFTFAGMAFVLKAVTPGGAPVFSLSQPLTVTVQYDEAALPPGMNENTLELLRYDSALDLWIPLTVLQRLPALDRLVMVLDHFSQFGLFAPSAAPRIVYLPVCVRKR